MSERIFTFLFVLFIGGLFLLNIFGEDQVFSEQENRVLTQQPSLSWKDFRSGKYTTELEKYISDQFPFKNQFVGIKGKVERAIGKQENNNVLFGKDGYLLERFTREDDRLDKNIALLNTFAATADVKKVYTLFPPTAIAIYPEKIPQYVSTVSQKETLDYVTERLSSEINMIPVHDDFIKAKGENLYFKTDHHWTVRGAYLAYVAAAKQMNFEPLSIDAFDIRTVSESFHGTLYSKATAYDHEPDKFELFMPKDQPSVEVTYEDGTVSDTMFELSYLDVKDKYSLFLDGNHSLVTIKTDKGTGRKLAILKDSYAHAFIPFLAAHYDEIHVLDLRYNKTALTPYLKDNGIDEVLFLYNLPNFAKDASLGLLR